MLAKPSFPEKVPKTPSNVVVSVVKLVGAVVLSRANVAS
jgi:hypothetical protein